MKVKKLSSRKQSKRNKVSVLIEAEDYNAKSLAKEITMAIHKVNRHRTDEISYEIVIITHQSNLRESQ